MRSGMICIAAFFWLLWAPAIPAGDDPAPTAAQRPVTIKNPIVDPQLFPIAVWLQDPKQAGRYRQAGINLYVALWKGPTEEQFKELTAAGMPVICEQNRVGLAHQRRSDHRRLDARRRARQRPGDRRPRNRQAQLRSPRSPCADRGRYQTLRAADPNRPIMLNLGQGVANDEWKGRGPGASLNDYPGYVRGADIVSFDVYPVAGLDRADGNQLLWYVAKGLDRLAKWTGGRQRIWNCIECTHISNPKAKATPHQVAPRSGCRWCMARAV